MMTVEQALAWARAQLPSPTPQQDAQLLLAHTLACSPTWLRTWPQALLTPDQQHALDAMVQRCAQGEPLAYVLGYWEFWSLRLSVNSSTLIPRADTECLVEQALVCLPAGAPKVLDLGTGTGAIALAIAHERPLAQVTAVDAHPEACALATHNAQALSLSRVQVLHSHWFSAVRGRFNVIVSNPPYLDAADPHLPQLTGEPLTALVAEQNGLADLEHIVQHAPQYLTQDGWLLLEHGWQQSEAVQALLQQAGFRAISRHKDYGGNWRVTLGQWPHPVLEPSHAAE